jgi:hypothetical protein
LNVTAGNSNAFQTYNSSLLQILDKSVNPVEQAAYNNDVRYALMMFFRTSLQVHSW